MAAKRDLVRITIRVDKLTGVAIDFELRADVEATEQGLFSQGVKVYAQDYANMSAPGKARIDSIVADANTVMQNREPIA